MQKVRFDESEDFANRSRDYVVRLQRGDPEVLALWRQFVEVSIAHAQDIYDKLGVGLKREHVRGESAYNADLPMVVSDLQDAALLSDNDGTKVVYLEEFRTQEKPGDGRDYPKRKTVATYTPPPISAPSATAIVCSGSSA
ncbi:arginine--tRNA ligase [Undibacterium arcticum]